MRLVSWPAFIVVLFVLFVPAVTGAQTASLSSTTYTVTLGADGAAHWQVEYRTPLASDADLAAFDNYTRELPTVALPQFRDLMEHSAAQASVATGRPMEITNFTGTTVVQASPTGRYGVVLYSFGWSGFSRSGDGILAGDAFTGGLYLAKDDTLIVKYPAGWTTGLVEPAPDDTRNGLAWYGLRSFGAGEPRIALERSSFPLLPVVASGILLIAVIVGFLIYRGRRTETPPEPEEPEEISVLTEEELLSTEDQILRLLRAHGGEEFQSEIVRSLGLPKSTVSSSLNELHGRGIIVKVRKGRENLIRLADGEPPTR